MPELKIVRDPQQGRTMIEHFRTRHEKLKQLRQPWETQGRQIVEEMLPHCAGKWFATEKNKHDNPFAYIYDTIATQNLQMLGAGMQAIASPPSGEWFSLTTEDPDLADWQPARMYLDDVTRRVEAQLHMTRTYRANPLMYVEAAAIGNACSIYAAVDDPMRYDGAVACHHTLTAGQYCVAQNDRGVIDTCYREFTMTVAQCIDRWKGKCSQRIKDLYANSQYDEDIAITHVIEPRRTRSETAYDNRNMKWRSVYFESTEDNILSESGFRRFPVIAPRWGILPDEAYGYGQGVMALSAVRSLQQKHLRASQTANLKTMPAMTGDYQLKGRDFGRGPGEFTFAPAQSVGTGLRPAWQPTMSLEEVLVLIEDARTQLNRIFFRDYFQMFADADMKDVRQEAILEKKAEKLMMLGPISAHLTDDMHQPEIELTYDAMEQHGMIPPPPPDLHGKPLKIRFESILAKAQRASNMGNQDKFLARMGAVAGWSPEVLDAIDVDEIADTSSAELGVPPSWTRDQKIRVQQRLARNQALAAQKQVESGNIQAQTAERLSKAKLGPGDDQNMLTAIGKMGRRG